MKKHFKLPGALINILIVFAGFILFFAFCPKNCYSQTPERSIVFQRGAVYDASSSRIVHGEIRYDQRLDYNELKFIMKDHDEALKFLKKSKRQEYVMMGMLGGFVVGLCVNITFLLDAIDYDDYPALIWSSLGASILFPVFAIIAAHTTMNNYKTRELYNHQQ